MSIKPFHIATTLALTFGFGSLSCKDTRGSGDDGDDTGATSLTTADGSGTTSTSAGTSTTGVKLDFGNDTSAGGCDADTGCTDQIDLLFIIDNSGTMAEEQENLARNFPRLIDRLQNLKDSNGQPVNPDVQIMVTTTDFSNPLCEGVLGAEPADYDPAKGAPISSPCTDRLARFHERVGMGQPAGADVEEACTNVCVNGAAPEGDPFIAFSPSGDNIPDSIAPTDINGDGVEDNAVAQALACIGPQGIDGCGYESPLENMLQALNQSAAWNQGARPFLRPSALLAIVVITDEADCSVKDWSIMNINEDDTYMEGNPDNGGAKEPTSAICWNAGVSCDGPDGDGVYTNCQSLDNDKLQPIARYTDYLITTLREGQGKEVVMLGILGVPEVTEHNPNPPYQPIAGGVADLVYRDWIDGIYPDGDILPDEPEGTTAAFKEFKFGIGPGCTGYDESAGIYTGQAIPPVRVKEVCEALNYEENGEEQIRCCIESICDDDFSAAIDCLTGIIQETIEVPG